MAAKKNTEKRISINNLDKMLNAAVGDNVVTVPIDIGEGETVDVHIKRTISFDEMELFVDVVADSVFVEEGGETVYSPTRYRSAFALSFFQFFTDLKIEMGLERLVGLMYATGIYDDLVSAASQAQLRAIEDDIYNAIEFRKQTILSGERIKLNYLMEQMDKMMPMLEQNAGLLAGMSQEDLTKAVQAMGNMDEGKLAKAVLKEQEGKVIEMHKPKKAGTRKKDPSVVD